MTTIRSDLRFSHHKTNGITLHVAEAGPPEGRLLVLLHGFPEFWYGWRHQIDALVAAGYRLVIPDQRGYNLSDHPKGVASYDLDLLARDIVDLAEGMGRQTFLLAGHDWGASVGWWIATQHPQRLEKLAAFGAPHPAVWVDANRNDPEQRKRSGYVRVFRLPWLPEFAMRQRNFKALADALRESKRPESCSDADLAKYREAWSVPGALTGMVNWYRALLAKRPPPSAPERIRVPTLVVAGDHDKYGIPALADRSGQLCEQASVVHLDTTHWMLHDEPERMSQLLLDFLKG
jgi:pimeloyl-ACP methyl ester carboxylesterase